MFNAEYTNTESLLATCDPRIKVVLLVLFSILIATCKTFFALSLALLIAFIVLLFAAVPLKQLLKRLLPVNTMIFFLWCILPFTTAGTPVFSYKFIHITNNGVILASILTLKANTMMLMFIAFVISTPVNTAGHAMQKLGAPDKLVHLFFFTYRYIHVIYSEYCRLKQAMIIRGFVPGTNLHTYKSYAYLVGMLLVKSADRANRVHNAMICRGFHGRFYSMTDYFITTSDIVVFILMFLLMILVGVIEWAPEILLLS